MPVTAAIGLGTLAYGVYSTAHAAAQKKKDDKAAQASIANRPDYQTSPYAIEALNDARSQRFATSPAVMAGMHRLDQGVTNQMGYAERVAGSGAQALAAGSSAEGQAMQQLPQLAAEQGDFEQRNRAAYLAALDGMSKEHQAGYESALGKYSDHTNYYLGKVGADSANMGQGIALAANGLASVAGNGVIRGALGSNTMARRVNTAPVATLAPSSGRMLPSPVIAPAMSRVTPVADQQVMPWSGDNNPFLRSYFQRMY